MAQTKPQLGFYSKKSALQAKFIAPIYKTINDVKYFSNHGFLLFEGVNGDNNNFDWSEKIAFAVGIGDMPHLLEQFHKWKFSKSKDINVELKHDPHAQSDKAGQIYKSLKITKGTKDGTFQLIMSSSNPDKRFYTYLSEGQLLVLCQILESMPTYMLGIDKTEERYESTN